MENAEKQLKKSRFSRWKRALSFALFLVLLGFVFTRITYLMRPTYVNRLNLVGFREEENDVDMVYIGGSSAFVYWQPLKAWHDRGMTSYLYAYNAMSAEGVRYCMEEVRRTQDVGLFVIDLRPFQIWSETGGHELRWGLDGLDVLSLARMELIGKYWSTRDTSEMDDCASFYLDIIKYHTAVENLASPTAWELADNTRENANKGWDWVPKWAYLNPPKKSGQERAQLHPTVEALLTELLDYCRSEQLNVQFVVPPYYVRPDQQAMYNTMADMIKGYGYNFLNANSTACYDEIGLDFSTDFYNSNHVNPVGAEKWTAYFEEYLAQRYDLPDHSGDPAYGAWDEDYEAFAQRQAEACEEVRTYINRADRGLKVAASMAGTDDVYEWNAWAADDSRFTILFAQKGELNVTDAAQIKILSQWGLAPSTDGAIRVRSGEKEIFTNTGGGTAYEDVLGVKSGQGVGYAVSNEGGKTSLIVKNEEYSLDRDGINIVVIDNDYRRVVDALAVVCEDGRLTIRR